MSTIYTDKQLVIGIKNADKKAIRYWHNHYYSEIFGFVLSKISINEDAEELTQDVFINSLKNINHFRLNSSLKTWMISIARHEIADYYRKRYAVKVVRTTPLGDYLLNHKIQDTHTVSELVKSALAQMNSRYKELLKLKYIDKKKVKNIAQMLGASIKSVESDLYRARLSFKSLFNKYKKLHSLPLESILNYDYD